VAAHGQACVCHDELSAKSQSIMTRSGHRKIEQGQAVFPELGSETRHKYLHPRSRGSSADTVRGYMLDGRGIGVWLRQKNRDFHFGVASRPALGPTQPSIKCVVWVLPPGQSDGAQMWLLNAVQCQRQKCVELYLHSPIYHHSAVLDHLQGKLHFKFASNCVRENRKLLEPKWILQV
jgi:hypothetical protein